MLNLISLFLKNIVNVHNSNQSRCSLSTAVHHEKSPLVGRVEALVVHILRNERDASYTRT